MHPWHFSGAPGAAARPAPADAPPDRRSRVSPPGARRPPPAASLSPVEFTYVRPWIVDASTTHRTATAGTDVGALASQREVQPRRVATRRCALEGELS
eukprot:COSAG03_NODE_12576_length_541_cov_0.705882_1_plen_97_part_01